MERLTKIVLICVLFIQWFLFLPWHANAQKPTLTPTSKDSNKVHLQFNLGSALPLLNFGTPVYQAYNQDQTFRTGFANTGFAYNFLFDYYLKKDFGFIAKFSSSTYTFNANSFSSSKLAAGDTVFNPHGNNHQLTAFLLGFIIRLPEGVASINNRIAINAYAMGGLMNLSYAGIQYNENGSLYRSPQLFTQTFAIDVGMAGAYSLSKYLSVTLNLDLLAGNAKFPDQKIMSYALFNPNIGLQVKLK